MTTLRQYMTAQELIDSDKLIIRLSFMDENVACRRFVWLHRLTDSHVTHWGRAMAACYCGKCVFRSVHRISIHPRFPCHFSFTSDLLRRMGVFIGLNKKQNTWDTRLGKYARAITVHLPFTFSKKKWTLIHLRVKMC